MVEHVFNPRTQEIPDQPGLLSKVQARPRGTVRPCLKSEHHAALIKVATTTWGRFEAFSMHGGATQYGFSL